IFRIGKCLFTSMELSETTGCLQLESFEDCLSTTSDDIFRDIFSRLDQYDLDEISMLSRRLHLISNSSRSQAIKIVAKLRVEQVNGRKFFLTLQLPSQCPTDGFILRIQSDADAKEPFRKQHIYSMYMDWPYYDGHFERSNLSNAVTARVAVLQCRFDFVKCKFDKICIDDTFLSFWEIAARTRDFASSFELHKSTFDLGSDAIPR
ncbi:hypothetical protein PENTCL1PPCAC_3776, partial [Pristionchus entomophagus]